MTWIVQIILVTLLLTATMVGATDLLSRHWEYRAVHIEGCTPYFDGS